MLSWEKRRRRDRPQTGVLTPGTSALTKLSPERATEHITCLISNCLYLCRPFGTFHVVAQLPGVTTPVCGLSSLRDFRVSPHELLLSRKPNYRRISRGALAFPRTTIVAIIEILQGCIVVVPASHCVPKGVVPNEGTSLHRLFQLLGQRIGVFLVQEFKIVQLH